MSLETSEPLHPNDDQLPPARRRRQRRSIPPLGSNSRVSFLKELTRQATNGLDYFAFAMLTAILSAAALLSDAPALYVLAALAAPFLAPMIGLSLSTLLGSPRFWGLSLTNLFISLLFVFGGGLAAGFFARGGNPADYLMAHQLAYVSLPDLLLLCGGMVAAMVMLSRSPEQAPRLASAAMAFELFLPAAAAGFGLSSGIAGLFQSALITVLIHIACASLLGTITLAVLGLRPNGSLGYVMSGAVVAVCLLAAILINGSVQLPQMPHLETAQLPTVRPTAIPTRTEGPTPTATPNLTATWQANQPTATVTRVTPTATLTPAPSITPTLAPTVEPVMAIIQATEGNGAVFRSGPYLSAPAVGEPYSTLLNGTYVRMYEVVENTDGKWARIRLLANDEVEGWVLRTLLSAEGSN